MTRRTVAAVAVVLVCGLLLGSGLAWVIGSLDDARDDVAALRGQLLEIGATPVVGPSGEPGAAGEAGDRGPAGPAGRDGRDGAPGPAGAAGPAGPVGATGPAGTDGVDGQDGTDGADGAPGEPGPTGPQGEPGPSCPDGYSLQPDTIQGEDVMVCTRDEQTVP